MKCITPYVEITPHLLSTSNMNLHKLVTCGYFFLYCGYFSGGNVLSLKTGGNLMQECTKMIMITQYVLYYK